MYIYLNRYRLSCTLAAFFSLLGQALNKSRLKQKLKWLKNRCQLLGNYRNLTAEEPQELPEWLQSSPSVTIADEFKSY